ncbi:MAG: DUF748 domain-containing protein [Bacteroidetes bacterium]|nr:DUF748 domain-containing protein [Bacteroidota bacterium]
MKKLLKILRWILIVVACLVLLVILFLGPIAKYIIEHKSEAWTGRVIRMEKLTINIFNGRVNAYGLKVFEQDKKTLFVGFRHLMVDLDEWKLLKSVYRVEHLLIEDPSVLVIRKGPSFNFDDILKKFASDTIKPKNPADTVPAKYFLEDLKINGGKVTFINDDYQLNIQLMKLKIAVPAFLWNDPNFAVRYDFILRTGGLFGGDLKLNLSTLEFTHNIHIDGLNLGVLYPYLTPYLKIKEFSGQLDLDIKTKGNFNDPQAIAMKGKSGIYKIVVLDEKGKKVAGFNMFTQQIDSLNIKKNIWKFGPILLDEPYFRYEQYAETNNLSALVLMSMTGGTAEGGTASSSAGGPVGFNPFVALTNYVNTLAQQIVITDYRVKRFSITGGMVDYYDHTLEEEFHLHLSELFFDVQQLNSQKNRVSVDFSTTVNKGGFIRADIDVNPNDFMDFGLKYEMKNVAVIDYNPYSIFHIAYPFKTGKVNYTGTITVKNHQIKMDNNLFMEKIYVGKKVKNSTAMHFPVKLALALLRDKHGNVTLVVPVEGDLDNPKFKWWKIVGQVFKNIFTKAVSAPASLIAGSSGGNEEDFKEIKFEFGQGSLTEKQVSQLEKVVKMLEEKPELLMELKQTVDVEKEFEYLTYQEAKKWFYFGKTKKQPVPDSLAKEDLAAVNGISITDTALESSLDRELKNKDPLLSPLEKCIAFFGAGKLKELQRSRMEKRNQYLEKYLTTRLNLPANRFKVFNNTDTTQIPEDRIPRYLISYSVPE